MHNNIMHGDSSISLNCSDIQILKVNQSTGDQLYIIIAPRTGDRCFKETGAVLLIKL